MNITDIDKKNRMQMHFEFISQMDLQAWIVSTDHKYCGANTAHLKCIGLSQNDTVKKL
ncbi:hypothetical protein SAMN02745945_01580 [Peptoclostridium litorale DSM 5388]|uniref:PAS domain-containing protein n=1 Tax=Peptoclostridium litorale DSM 5388 TaxID=1121324 RepID=A0A069RPQ8_PEPLI|nr:hypothetical protein CLIT_5c01540 [Peptoclostridium litorale DSM 5388]SIO03712.1 hypothetical protein SAMN02745945_01580 [Peptoclostridium litorale DSM 5388]